MAEVPITRCLWCGALLEQRSKGRQRRYCSTRCRVRASRQRHSRDWSLIGRPRADVVAGAEPEATLLHVLGDLRVTANILSHLAPYLGPLAGRAETTAAVIADLLEREWRSVFR